MQKIFNNINIINALNNYGCIKSINKLNKALTNNVYKIEYINNNIVLKIFNTTNKNLFNRNLEYTIYNLLHNKNITPNVLYLHKYKFALLQYIPNIPVIFNKENIIALAKKIYTIHTLPIKDNRQNLLKLSNNYINKINQHSNNIDSNKFLIIQHYLTTSFNKLNTLPVNLGFCHNDLNFENLLLDNNNNLWILDFEYARKSDIYFDLSSISRLLNNEQFSWFISEYSKLSNVVLDNYKLNIYSTLIASLSCLWALNFNYKHIFYEYFNIATNYYNKVT